MLLPELQNLYASINPLILQQEKELYMDLK